MSVYIGAIYDVSYQFRLADGSLSGQNKWAYVYAENAEDAIRAIKDAAARVICPEVAEAGSESPVVVMSTRQCHNDIFVAPDET